MTNPQRVRTSRGHTRCHSASLAKIVTGSISEAPRSNPANDLRHFAATMFASTGASTKQIMSRGVWKSVAMVVRYEHASEERDAQLAQGLNAFTMGDNVVPLTHELSGDRARARATRLRRKVRCWTYRH